jgi:endonuclease YncB( thermonuclease family)
MRPVASGFLFLVVFLYTACAGNVSGNRKTKETQTPASNLPASGEISGTAVKIIDGDTYDLLLASNNTERIRLAGIDCPERTQDFYQVAKNRLGEICLDKTLTVRYKERDRNGRIVGHTYLDDGTWVNAQLIREGLAWHFLRYSSDSTLAGAERSARAAKKHIWSLPEPMAPWDFRSAQRSKP